MLRTVWFTGNYKDGARQWSHFLVSFISGAALHVSEMFDPKTKKLPLTNFVSFTYTRSQPGNHRFSAVAKQTSKSSLCTGVWLS